MRWFRQNQAFTFIEMLIVIVIVALLVVIAVPNFMNARRNARDRVCKNNLRLIKHALEQYQSDEKIANGTDVRDVYTTIISGKENAYIEDERFCPVNDVAYTVTTIEADPTCTNRDQDPTNPDFKNHFLPSFP